MTAPAAKPLSHPTMTTGGHVLAFAAGGRALAFATGGHVLAFTVPRYPETPATTAASGAVGPGATRFGASSPVLGGVLVGGRSAAVGSTHLVAARDPVPHQVRRAVSST